MPRSLSVAITLVAAITTSSAALAAQPLRVYGPGGPLPAMKDAAAAFERSHGVAVEVTAGRTPQWIDHAKVDADLIFSGSEAMMSDFMAAMPEIDPSTVRALYLRRHPRNRGVRSCRTMKIAHLTNARLGTMAS